MKRWPCEPEVDFGYHWLRSSATYIGRLEKLSKKGGWFLPCALRSLDGYSDFLFYTHAQDPAY